MGDVAMMQVAARRLCELWPCARIEAVTSAPHLLRAFCPAAVPAPFYEKAAWMASRDLCICLRQSLPACLACALFKCERTIWLRLPALADLALWIKSVCLGRPFSPPAAFRSRLKSADILVVSGMGILNDPFAGSAISLLDEIEAALNAGLSVFAFGQGVGPITDPLLWRRARAVLPRLALISLREGRTGLPLLRALGVPPEKILVTGDDAIELALEQKPSEPGNAIGVSLRLADYAGTDQHTARSLAAPLQDAADALHAPLVPVPISFEKGESDIRSAELLLGPHCREHCQNLACPQDVIRLIGSCRVVVTGAYHAGVFALAQGIPVVALIQSPYYEQKFKGLQQQFPEGCHLLDLRTPLSSAQIRDTVLAAAHSADHSRDSLLAAAARQVELSRQAYRQAASLYPLPQ